MTEKRSTRGAFLFWDVDKKPLTFRVFFGILNPSPAERWQSGNAADC